MTADLQKKLQAIITAAQILDLRSTGHADLLPPEFAKFSDEAIAGSLVQDAVAVLAAVRDNDS